MGGRGSSSGFGSFGSLEHKMTGTEKQIAFANKCLNGLTTNANAVKSYYEDKVSDAKSRGKEKTAERYSTEYSVIKSYQNRVFDHAKSIKSAGDVINSYKGWANGDYAKMSKAALAGVNKVVGLKSIGVSQSELDAAIGDAQKKRKAKYK